MVPPCPLHQRWNTDTEIYGKSRSLIDQKYEHCSRANTFHRHSHIKVAFANFGLRTDVLILVWSLSLTTTRQVDEKTTPQSVCTTTLHYHLALPPCTTTLHYHLALPPCSATLLCHLALPPCSATWQPKLFSRDTLPRPRQPGAWQKNLFLTPTLEITINTLQNPWYPCIVTLPHPIFQPVLLMPRLSPQQVICEEYIKVHLWSLSYKFRYQHILI